MSSSSALKRDGRSGARASRHSVPAEKVRLEVERLMATGEWRRGKSAKALAASTGYTQGAIERWSAETSRRLRAAMTDDDLRAEVVGRLDELAELAKGKGEFHAAVQALRAMLEARGLIERGAKVEIHVEQVPLAEKVSALLAHPELGPALERAVLERKGLLVETTGETSE